MRDPVSYKVDSPWGVTSEVILQPPYVQVYTWMYTSPTEYQGSYEGSKGHDETAWVTPYGERVAGCREAHRAVVILHQQWCNSICSHGCWCLILALCFLICMHLSLLIPWLLTGQKQHPITLVMFLLRKCFWGPWSFHQETMRTTDSILFLDITAFNANSEMYWNVMLFRDISINIFLVMV